MNGMAAVPAARRHDRAREHVDAAHASLLDAVAELQRRSRNDATDSAARVDAALERALSRAAVTVAALSDTLAAAHPQADGGRRPDVPVSAGP